VRFDRNHITVTVSVRKAELLDRGESKRRADRCVRHGESASRPATVGDSQLPDVGVNAVSLVHGRFEANGGHFRDCKGNEGGSMLSSG
jgi:hypothetical protein